MAGDPLERGRRLSRSSEPVRRLRGDTRSLTACLLHAVRTRFDGTVVLWGKPGAPERRILIEAGWVVALDPLPQRPQPTVQLLRMFEHQGEIALYPGRDLRDGYVDLQPIDPYPYFLAATRLSKPDPLAEEWFAAQDPAGTFAIRETGELHRMPYQGPERLLFDRLRAGPATIAELVEMSGVDLQRLGRLLHLFSLLDVLECQRPAALAPDPPDRLVERARRIEGEGRTAEALAVLEEGIQRNLGDSDLWTEHARVLLSQKLSARGARQAMRSLRHALRADPSHARAHFYLGKLWEQYGDERRASACREKALGLDPTLAALDAPAETVDETTEPEAFGTKLRRWLGLR